MAKVKPVEVDAADIVEKILHKAVDERASDVHFQSEREDLTVRFRIDGVLYVVQNIPQYLRDGAISFIKLTAQMDIVEHQIPQGGRLEFNHKGRLYDIRVSSIPTIYGEALVLRIFNRESNILKIEELGFDSDQIEVAKQIIANPYGMVLITGPSGSGKTTFLYSILNALNKPERNIISIEDPVEFHLDGVRQVQISEKKGMDFAKAIREMMRQDANVTMLGEIRDSDTAGMAFQAALTGILVLSTFHTFDVAGLIVRFTELDIPRSVISHALTSVISTRLVRRICSACSANYEPSDLEKRFCGIKHDPFLLQRGEGCEACRNTGYLGRTGIFEIVYFDDEIQTRILEEASPSAMRELFKKKTDKTLYDAVLQKIYDGVTTVDEAIRVVGMPLEVRRG
ncbi:MAG: type II/IV secretion system protein [Candidatus Liptonbacteria bacterium]|nr:type II/IV secretion system protein [Candidatus Liptonbacteria bacterium]